MTVLINCCNPCRRVKMSDQPVHLQGMMVHPPEEPSKPQAMPPSKSPRMWPSMSPSKWCNCYGFVRVSGAEPN